MENDRFALLSPL